MGDNTKLLSGIKPLKNPDDDRLSFAGFAENLAKGICNMMPPEGLVIAIYGPWGSGKSTVIEFIVSFLGRFKKNGQPVPVIMRFNPWWFSGQEGLVRHFFDQLEAVISNRKNKFGRGVKGVVESVRKLSDVVAAVPIPGAALPKAIADNIPNLDTPLEVTKIKEDIAHKLEKANKRILVIIDDIDRLTADEIKQLFAVIKGIADFPNIIYLLAFDRNVVSLALDPNHNEIGDRYLEKIIQVSFDLPVAGKNELFQLLVENLESIIGEIPKRLFEKRSFLPATGLLLQLVEFINTPRVIFRICNSLSVTYPAVQNEVNAADFVAIESLRILAPDVHELIKNNKNAFLGKTVPESLEQQRVLEVVSNLGAAIQGILSELFPALSNAVVPDDLLRKELRICAHNFFDVYFRFSIPTNSASNVDVQAILASMSDKNSFRDSLMEFATRSPQRLSSLLSRVVDYTHSDIPTPSIKTVTQVLLDIGDQLLGDSDQFPFDMNTLSIVNIIIDLLERVELAEQVAILTQSLMDGKAHALGIIVITAYTKLG